MKARLALGRRRIGSTENVTPARFYRAWIPNRQLPLLEVGPTHCKQRLGRISNRQFFGYLRFRTCVLPKNH